MPVSRLSEEPWTVPVTGSVFCQAETRAEFAERSVAKLEKTIDDLEGTFWGLGSQIDLREKRSRLPKKGQLSIVPGAMGCGWCWRLGEGAESSSVLDPLLYGHGQFWFSLLADGKWYELKLELLSHSGPCICC